MGNSPLVSYTRLSPNYSRGRNHSIDWFIPHCVVGQCSVETLGNIFASPSKEASCNYGIGYDGRVGMYVEECNRSWCTSGPMQDNRGITVECASDAYNPYAFKDVVYKRLIDLAVDCCQRNGKNKIIWFGDKNKTLNYTPAKNEMVIAVHRWFASKSCPGDWLYNRLGDFAKAVNDKLQPKEIPNPPNTPTKDKSKYRVTYSSHCQKFGWLPYVGDGETSGTMGQSKRMEAIKIMVNKPKGVTGDIWYQTHVQSIGWMDPVKNDAVSGTTGQGKRIEAIKIALSTNGNISKKYDIYYRAYCQTYGWLDWAKNNQIAGTTGLGKRMEAIQIKLVKKGSKAPGPTTNPSKSK